MSLEFNARLRGIPVYPAAETYDYRGELVKLASNETPWSPHPQVLEAIRAHGWDRFGICDALPCRCVFVDRSRNRSRRYCCDLCADRATQAAARARRRGDSPPIR